MNRSWNITLFGIIVIVVLSVGYTAAVFHISPEIGQGLYFGLLGGFILALSIYGERSDRIKQITQPVAAILTAFASLVIMIGFGMIARDYYSQVIAGTEFLSSFSGIGDIVTLAPGIAGTFFVFGGTIGLGAGFLFLLADRIDGADRIKGTTSLDLVFFIILVVLVTLLGVGDLLFNILRSAVAGISLIAILGYVLSSGTGFDGVIAGILIIVSYFVTSRAWRYLPIASLVPRHHKDRYDTLAAYEPYFRYGVVPLVGLVLIIDSVGGLSIFPFVFGVLRSAGVREMLLELTAVSLVALIAVRLIRTFTQVRTLSQKYGTYVIYLGLLYLISTPLGIILEATLNVINRAELPFHVMIQEGSDTVIEFMGGHEPVALAIFALILGIGILIKTMFRSLELYGVVPPGLDGTAFISLSIFMMTVSMGLMDQMALLLIGTALTLIIWAFGKRMTELGREIGHTGHSIQSQVSFLGGSLLLGVIGVVVGSQAVTIFENITLEQPESSSAILALLVFTGIALLVTALRTHLQD